MALYKYASFPFLSLTSQHPITRNAPSVCESWLIKLSPGDDKHGTYRRNYKKHEATTVDNYFHDAVRSFRVHVDALRQRTAVGLLLVPGLPPGHGNGGHGTAEEDVD